MANVSVLAMIYFGFVATRFECGYAQCIQRGFDSFFARMLQSKLTPR
jgi:hypothetical protein